ncbi:MAG: DUF4149 domain-containing protein [Thermodesulfobacteriota bacterium]
MHTLLRFLYLISLVFWIGTIFFFSTSAAPSIFKVLPKQMAGELVTDIFLKYYLISYICGVVAIVTSLLSWFTGTHSSTVSYLLRVAILVIMLGLSIFAGTVIRPQALEIRTEMRSLTKDSPRHSELHNRFNTLHKRSVLLNSVVFLLGIAIVFITAYNYRE